MNVLAGIGNLGSWISGVDKATDSLAKEFDNLTGQFFSFVGLAHKDPFKALFVGLSKMVTVGMKSGKLFKSIFLPFGKVKSKKLKLFGKGMKAFGKIGLGVMGILLMVMEKLGVLDPILQVISAIFGIIGGNILKDLMPLMQELFDVLLGDDAMSAFTAIATLATAMLTPLMELAITILPLLFPLIEALATGLSVVAPFLTGFVGIIGDFIGFFTGDVGTIVGTIVTAIGDFFGWFGEGIATVIEGIVTALSDFFNIFVGWTSWFDTSSSLSMPSGTSSNEGLIPDNNPLLGWLGPDIYSFNKPTVVGVGDEPQNEYLMREDKLLQLLENVGGNEETNNLLRTIANNTKRRPVRRY